MSGGTKQQFKQFSITCAEDACLVLGMLISGISVNLEKYKEYASEAESLLESTQEEYVPAKEYDDVNDKLLYRQREILKYTADHQSSSFSYIDLRKILEKHKYISSPLSEEVSAILSEFLDVRNWTFHNPQSLMVAAKEAAHKDIPDELKEIAQVTPQLNPVLIRKICRYELVMLASLTIHAQKRIEQFEKVLRSMKADYQEIFVPVDFSLPLGNINAFDGCVGRRCGLLGIGDIRQLSMLRPVSAVIPGNVPVASGDLDLVIPARGAFNSQTVAYIDTDMTFHPNGLTDFNLGEIGSHVLADFDHAVGTDVRYAVTSISGTAVDGVFVSFPAPEHTLDKANAVKAEGVGRGCVDHGGSGRLAIVAVILGVTFLVGSCHRSTEAAHHIERFVVLCDILELIRKFNVRHHDFHPPFLHGRGAVRVRLSASQG